MRGSPGDESDLADEVAGAELVDDAPFADDVGLALDEDDELEAARPLAASARAPPGRSSSSASAAICAELALRAALEQRNPLQQLDLRVLAQHRPGTVSCMTQSGAMIVDAVRSPIGKKNGTLSHIRGDELAAQVVNALVARNGVDPAEIEDVQWGCVTQVDEQAWNIGRNVALTAGWPVSVAGTTVDRQCGSSMQTNFNAAAAVWSGQLDLVVSGGVEMMSRVPMGSNNGSMSPLVCERHDIVMQGISAEEIAKQWELTREELDRISYESHQRAARAIDEGRFEQGGRPDRARRAGVGRLRRCADAHARPLRGRRGGAARDDAREDGVAAAGVHPGRRRDGRELVPDRRRLGGRARRVGGEGRRSSGSSRGRGSSPSASSASTRT